MVNKENGLNCLGGVGLFLYVFFLVLGYEIHAYQYQPLPQVAAFFILIIYILTKRKIETHGNFPMFLVMVFLGWAIFSKLIGLFIGFEYVWNDITKVMAVFFVFLSYSFLNARDVEKIFRLIYYFSVCLSVFNVILLVAGGRFLWWEAIYGTRYSSVFYLHNFAGALFGFQLIYSAYCIELSRRSRIFGFLFGLVALVITFSKGGGVAFFAAVFITLFVFSRLYLKVVYLVLVLVCFLFFDIIIENLDVLFPRFRFFSGLNERDEMWSGSLSAFESVGLMLLGGGESYLHGMIDKMGKDYSSTHNYFVDTFVSSGAFGFVFLLCVSFTVLYGLYKKSNSRLFFSIAAYLIVSANKSRFSIGGITLLSVMLSLVVVYAIHTWSGCGKFNIVKYYGKSNDSNRPNGTVKI